MLEYINEDGVKQGINPFDNGSAYTDIMKTQALKQALTNMDLQRHSVVAAVTRRNPEQKRESSLSVMKAQAWDPKNQRPEMWKLYNTRSKGESMRVFPISNWTEKDIWQYIKRENIQYCSIIFCKRKTGCIQRRKYHHGG